LQVGAVLDGTYVERKGGGKILTTLLTRLAAQSGPEAAAEVLRWAASKGHDVNAFHYGVVVHAWARQKQWQHALTLVDDMQVCLDPQRPHALQQPGGRETVANCLDTQETGSDVEEPVVLLRYAAQAAPNVWAVLFAQEAGVEPTLPIMSTVMRVLARAGNADRAVALWVESAEHGLVRALDITPQKHSAGDSQSSRGPSSSGCFLRRVVLNCSAKRADAHHRSLLGCPSCSRCTGTGRGGSHDAVRRV
jgi:hypothetical protein